MNDTRLSGRLVLIILTAMMVTTMPASSLMVRPRQSIS